VPVIQDNRQSKFTEILPVIADGFQALTELFDRRLF
jgi:hypothetical protein